MRRIRAAFIACLLASSTAGATWSVIAVDTASGTVVIASATCVPQERFATFPATGLKDIQAIVVPGAGVAAAQASVDRTRANQKLIYSELSRGTPPAEVLERLRSELRWESDLQYYTSGDVRPWDYNTQYRAQYLNLLDSLRTAMARTPFLKVLVANGYYDSATPSAATEWTFDHLGFEPTFRERIRMAYYEAGHMMYVHPEMLAQMKRDLARFYESTRASATERGLPPTEPQ